MCLACFVSLPEKDVFDGVLKCLVVVILSCVPNRGTYTEGKEIGERPADWLVHLRDKYAWRKQVGEEEESRRTSYLETDQ